MATGKSIGPGRRTAWRAALRMTAIAALGASACGPHVPDVTARPNVLLIVVDTLRADHLGCYGDPAGCSPTLDALARRSAQFRCLSQAPWTLPSVATILSGRYPAAHGANFPRRKLPETVPVLAEAFRREGYATAAFVAHTFLSPAYGFARGFDVFDDSNARGHQWVSAPGITGLATEWLESRPDDRPFFLFLHYFDPHYNYLEHEGWTPPGDYHGSLRPNMEIWNLRRRLRQMGPADVAFLRRLYHGEIRLTDAWLGRLRDELEERGLESNTVIVVTADHGEEFLEHGWLGHTRNLHEVVLDVPLLVSAPGTALAAGPRSRPAMLIDVAPTVAALTGITREETPGADLSRPPDADRPLYAEVTYDPDVFTKKPERELLRQAMGLSKRADLRSLQAGPWKVVEDRLEGTFSLYRLDEDPGETRDLAGERPEELARMRAMLEASTAGEAEAAGEEVLVSDEELEQLRSLGYAD